MNVHFSKIKIDYFVLATITVIALAYFFPISNSYVSNGLTQFSRIGIACIFFFYGLKLDAAKIKQGLKNWKLHVLIQSSTFLFFPILILPFYFLISSPQTEKIWLAFLFLAALPSTVSSSVVFVSIAKGNLPAAIFNASISGLIGIMVTPLWMSFFISNEVAAFDLHTIYYKLLIEIIVPILLGLLLQSYIGKYAHKNASLLSKFDKSIILLIIYLSFSDAFQQRIFSSVSFLNLVSITLCVITLFYTMFYSTAYIARKLHFNQEDETTAQFCGTKKSLVHGTVFSHILFPSTFPIGLLLLPLMLFHSFQLFIVSIYASKRASNTNK